MDYKLSCEYREVALRIEQIKASGKTEQETANLLDMLEAVAEPVYVSVRHRPLSSDPNDDMILDIAINGRADAIITGNTKHFLTPAEQFHLKVMTPAELLSKLREKR